MNRGTFASALFVIALISVDISSSIAHAQTKTTIYKVTKISSGKTLRLRAWPSPKSRIKVSLPHNAKDITETGKRKKLGSTKWIEVRWGKNKGWVNSRYLKKTGVLLKTDKQIASKIKPSVKSRKKASAKISGQKTSSRNTHAKQSSPSISLDIPPQEFGGDRYDQTLEIKAKEIKTAYIPKKNSERMLSCLGDTPKPWNMKLSINGNTMNIDFPKKRPLKVPLQYNEWTSNSKARMSLGGNRGRNTIVDVSLERTNTCRVSSSTRRFSYEIKTTINNQFYSGCCQ